MQNSNSKPLWKRPIVAGGVLVALLVFVLGLMFIRSLRPELVIFSNDFPYGSSVAEGHKMPAPLLGVWNTLNWVGYYVGNASLNLTRLAFWLLGPLYYAKTVAPLSLLFLGVCTAVFLRSLGFSYIAVALGAFAAMLNSDFFSSACWGIVMWPTCIGLSFLTLAALANERSPRRWLRVVLAGAALGLGVADGFDVGAIFSLGIAAFIMYQALISKSSSRSVRVSKGVLTTAGVALVAGLVAFNTIYTLVGTQIKGVAGMQAGERDARQHWDWATQWSLPKKEILSLAVPGLFGYRMDTPNGGSYWGQVGRQPGWEQHHQGFPRYIGSGFYVGVLVILVAAWTLAQSFRKKGSVFSDTDRKWIWFWGGMCVVSILLSFGRYAPFYRLVYALPFFSTIRNPIKFQHVVSWALVVLFAYGINGLVKTYASQTMRAVSGGSWWKRLSAFDRRWVAGAGAVFFVSFVAWLVYATSKKTLEAYLGKEGIDPGLASMVAGFSISQAGVFVLLFGIALAMVTLALTGFFRGPRSPWLGIVLGLFLVFDLGHANQPWIVYVNYKQKYATNPVIDFLRNKPYEHRVAMLPFPMPDQLSLLDQLYRIEWHQQLFPYYNIQSLDLVQMPRMPEDMLAFDSAFRPDPSKTETIARVLRRWELTNTRYLLGPAGFVDALNAQLDAARKRFRIAMAFDIVRKPGVARVTRLDELTAVPSPKGRYAVIEFTGALPRASLYAHWQVETNNAAALQRLASPEFDPSRTVLVDKEIKPPPVSESTNTPAGTVEIVSYASKHVVLQASNALPAVLLFNDKYDPNWKVTVNGQPAELLRCNSVMRGVSLESGRHRIEFAFKPPVNSLYVSVTAMAVSLVLLGFLMVANVRDAYAQPHAAVGDLGPSRRDEPNDKLKRGKTSTEPSALDRHDGS